MRGVEVYKDGWLARIQIRGTRCRFGMFANQQEAARVYDRLSYKLHGARAVTNGTIDEDAKAEIESSSLESMLAVVPAIDPHPLYESAWQAEGGEEEEEAAEQSMSYDSDTTAPSPDRIRSGRINAADAVLPELLEAESRRRVSSSSEPWASPCSQGSGRISRSEESSCACCDTRECTNAYKRGSRPDPVACEWDRPSRRYHGAASSNSGSVLGITGSDSGSNEVNWNSGRVKRSRDADCNGDGDGDGDGECPGMLVFTVRKKRRMRSRPHTWSNASPINDSPIKASPSNGSERIGAGSLTTARETVRSGEEILRGAEVRFGAGAELPVRVKAEPSASVAMDYERDTHERCDGDSGPLLCSEDLLTRSRETTRPAAQATPGNAREAADAPATPDAPAASRRRARARGRDGNGSNGGGRTRSSGASRSSGGGSRSSSGGSRSRGAVTTVRVEFDPAYCWKMRAEPAFPARPRVVESPLADLQGTSNSATVEVAVALSSCTRFEPPRYTPGSSTAVAVRDTEAVNRGSTAVEVPVALSGSSRPQISVLSRYTPFSLPRLPPMVQSSPATSPVRFGSQDSFSHADVDSAKAGGWIGSMESMDMGTDGGEKKADSSIYVAAQWLVDMAAGRSAAVC
ncbi:unnamed protein product [Closterium sp. Yama58-4]|nr:unnamed protein product [Closterium sp. Yama58-4]